MIHPLRLTALVLFMLASLPGTACHSSDNFEWVVVSNPSGDPNLPNSGGGTVIVTKSSVVAVPGQKSVQQSEERDAAEVLPRFLDQFSASVRTALQARGAATEEFVGVLIAQVRLSMSEDRALMDRDLEGNVSASGLSGKSYELPILELLAEMESVAVDSELPSYQQSMRSAASLRMGLAAINVMLAQEREGSALFDLPPVPVHSRAPIAGSAGDMVDGGVGHAGLRSEFLAAARAQIRAAYADYSAFRAELDDPAPAFLLWAQVFVGELRL